MTIKEAIDRKIKRVTHETWCKEAYLELPVYYYCTNTVVRLYDPTVHPDPVELSLWEADDGTDRWKMFEGKPVTAKAHREEPASRTEDYNESPRTHNWTPDPWDIENFGGGG